MLFQRLILGSVVLAVTALGQDVNDIVRKALSREVDRQTKLANYTWEQRTTHKTFDSNRKVKETKVRVQEHLVLEGSEYHRLIEVDGQPLPPARVKQEQEKMDAEIARRRAESASARRKRLEHHEENRKEAIRFREEVLQAFDFRLTGEETIAGFPCYRITGEPKRGFSPKTREGKLLLGKIHGTIWVSKAGFDLVRVDAETIAKITFGGFLASLGPGAHIEVQMMRVNDELWHPQSVRLGLNARALWQKMNLEEEISWRNFRKFQTESRIVATGEPDAR